MKLFFRKTGEGKPVVILHGLFGMSDNWQSFARMLAEKHFTVYSVDLRNHGQSFHDQAFNYKLMAEDLFQFFNDNQINDPSIIGHSLGGKTAMQYALLYEQNINRLLVIDISPRYYPMQHDQLISALNAVDLSEIKSRKEAEIVLDQFKMDVATKQFLLKNLYWKSENKLAWRFNLKAIENNKEEIGKEIISSHAFMKPALFIRGEKSNYINDDDFSGIRKLFQLAEIKTAPASGHWVHADNPGWLVVEAIAFLNK